jgi:hypothetical protein
MIFNLSSFRTSFLAADYLLIWDRTKFDAVQELSSLLWEIMTLVSANMGSDKEFFFQGKVICIYYEQ